MKACLIFTINVFVVNFALAQRVDTIGDFIVRITKNETQNKVLIYDTKEPDPEKRWHSQPLQGKVVAVSGSKRTVVIVTNSNKYYGYAFAEDRFYTPQPLDGSFINPRNAHITSTNGTVGVLTDMFAYVFAPIDNKLYTWSHQRVQGNIIKIFGINGYIIALTENQVYTRGLNGVWEHFPLINGSRINTHYRFENDQLVVEVSSSEVYIFLGNGKWQKK